MFKKILLAVLLLVLANNALGYSATAAACADIKKVVPVSGGTLVLFDNGQVLAAGKFKSAGICTPIEESAIFELIWPGLVVEDIVGFDPVFVRVGTEWFVYGLNRATYGWYTSLPVCDLTLVPWQPPQDGNMVVGGNEGLARIGSEVWTWGLNDAGQGGDGTRIQTWSPGPVAPTIGLTNVVQFDGGGWISLAVTANGDIFGWGNTSSGGICMPSGIPPYQLVPARISNPGAVSLARTNGKQTYFLTSAGLYGCGRNTNGELGDPAICPGGGTPCQIGIPAGAVDVVLGVYNLLALMPDGSVWSFGPNSLGGAGTGDILPKLTPSPIPGLAGITRVFGGRYFDSSYAWDGRILWVWGDNTSGQLGTGSTFPTINTPTPIDLDAIRPSLGNTLRVVKTSTRSVEVTHDGILAFRTWLVEMAKTDIPPLAPVQRSLLGTTSKGKITANPPVRDVAYFISEQPSILCGELGEF